MSEITIDEKKITVKTASKIDNYTPAQVAEYMAGYFPTKSITNQGAIEAAINNALICMSDPFDGIYAYFARKEYKL